MEKRDRVIHNSGIQSIPQFPKKKKQGENKGKTGRKILSPTGAGNNRVRLFPPQTPNHFFISYVLTDGDGAHPYDSSLFSYKGVKASLSFSCSCSYRTPRSTSSTSSSVVVVVVFILLLRLCRRRRRRRIITSTSPPLKGAAKCCETSPSSHAGTARDACRHECKHARGACG